MSDESMLQALEHTADQIDRLSDIIDEFLTMGEAGVLMSATTCQKYAAEMDGLRGSTYAFSRAVYRVAEQRFVGFSTYFLLNTSRSTGS